MIDHATLPLVPNGMQFVLFHFLPDTALNTLIITTHSVGVRIGPPVGQVGEFVTVGLNYVDHGEVLLIHP